jgi:hypothetical protein
MDIKKYNDVILEDKSYYFIQDNVIEVLKKINDTEKIISDVQKKPFKNIFLTANEEYYYGGFGFWRIKNEDNKKDAIYYYERKKGYTYKGELKLIDDKLVLDTLEIDIKKYNV